MERAEGSRVGVRQVLIKREKLNILERDAMIQ